MQAEVKVESQHEAIFRADISLLASQPLTLSPSHPLTLSPSHPLTLRLRAGARVFGRVASARQGTPRQVCRPLLPP